MTKSRQQVSKEAAEPMGIVISGGYTAEAPSTFWAYVWSDVPETNPNPKAQAA